MIELPPKECLNLEPLHEMTGGDPAFESELILLFLDATENSLYAMETIEKDPGAWSDLLHSFKGACVNIGALKMAQLCDEGIASGYSPETARTLLEKLSAEYTMVKNYLASLCV